MAVSSSFQQQRRRLGSTAGSATGDSLLRPPDSRDGDETKADDNSPINDDNAGDPTAHHVFDVDADQSFPSQTVPNTVVVAVDRSMAKVGLVVIVLSALIIASIVSALVITALFVYRRHRRWRQRSFDVDGSSAVVVVDRDGYHPCRLDDISLCHRDDDDCAVSVAPSTDNGAVIVNGGVFGCRNARKQSPGRTDRQTMKNDQPRFTKEWYV